MSILENKMTQDAWLQYWGRDEEEKEQLSFFLNYNFHNFDKWWENENTTFKSNSESSFCLLPLNLSSKNVMVADSNNWEHSDQELVKIDTKEEQTEDYKRLNNLNWQESTSSFWDKDYLFFNYFDALKLDYEYKFSNKRDCITACDAIKDLGLPLLSVEFKIDKNISGLNEDEANESSCVGKMIKATSCEHSVSESNKALKNEKNLKERRKL